MRTTANGQPTWGGGEMATDDQGQWGALYRASSIYSFPAKAHSEQ